VCGKLVVATNEGEEARLDELLRRGQANGLAGLERLGPPEMRKIEPHVGGIAAAKVPQEGIVDYRGVCDRLLYRLQEWGARIATGAKVTRLGKVKKSWVASTPQGDFSAEFIINCGGLHCDRVAELAGEKREVRIVPFRGEYYKLKPGRQDLVRHLIYPVPDPQFPFLGVHFTRLIHGGIEAGPNAVLAFAREGYSLTSINPRDLFDAVTFPGLWRFLRKYPSMVSTELAQSFSRERFCRSLQKLVPEVRPDDLETGGAGVRAQAMTPGGDLVQDFHIITRENALHVLNAPSPAATASLAIGAHIVGLLPF
jgi:L-2-hydroxyglutarate oxidase